MDIEDISIVQGKNRVIMHIKEGIETISFTFLRFPLVLLLFFTMAVIIIYRSETIISYEHEFNEILDRIMLVIVLGIPLALCVDLLVERFEKTKAIILRTGLYLVNISIIIAYFFMFLPNTEMIHVQRTMLITFSLVLMFLTIPYILKKENFEIYITNIITRIGVMVFFTAVLGAGLSLIFFAIKTLLYEALNTNIFYHIWALSWLVFAPFQFLKGLPDKEHEFSLEDYSKVLKILFLYIILPIISVYTVVLYLYFTKVLVVRELAMATYLVVSYAAVGIFALFLIRPLIGISKWAKWFSILYTKLIFPLLILLFVSIGMRIDEYGITENRYYILVIGIWCVGVMIFTHIVKGKYNTILPISLAIIVFLSAVGPWNAFYVSRWSQNNRFTEILERNNMLVDGQVIPVSQEINDRDKREIFGIIKYFDQFHNISDAKYLPKDFNFNKMEEVFELNYRDIDFIEPKIEENNFYFSRSYETPINISAGYNLYILMYINDYENQKDYLYEKIHDEPFGKLEIKVDKDYKLILLNDDLNIFSYDLKAKVRELYKQGEFLHLPEDVGKSISWNEESDGARVMFVIKDINGSVDNTGAISRIDYMTLDVLIGIK